MGKRIHLTDTEIEVLTYMIDNSDAPTLSSYKAHAIFSTAAFKKLRAKLAPPLKEERTDV